MGGDFSSQSGESRVSMSVSVRAEASSLLRALVAPPAPGESVKALIARGARRAGLSFERARKLWYQEAGRILADEMDALRAAARRRCGEANELARKSQDLGDSLDRIDAELAHLRARLASRSAADPPVGPAEAVRGERDSR